MADLEPVDLLGQSFINEKTLVDARDKTPAARKLASIRHTIESDVRAIGRSGDLDQILRAERLFLENDLSQYANSRAMKSSLSTALEELNAAMAVAPLVDDPDLYRAVDIAHAHKKSRTGGLPKDAARLFFASHAARLLNQDKSRLDPEEKTILDQRKANMRVADGLYAARQRTTLGLDASHDRSRDRGLSL